MKKDLFDKCWKNAEKYGIHKLDCDEMRFCATYMSIYMPEVVLIKDCENKIWRADVYYYQSGYKIYYVNTPFLNRRCEMCPFFIPRKENELNLCYTGIFWGLK